MSNHEEEHIRVSTEDGVMIIQMNRPHRKNALTQGMYATMNNAFATAKKEKSIRCVLVTGTQECFSSGNDVKDFMNVPPTGPESPVFQFLQMIVDFEKPVVAAVCGHAIGIGTTMLLHFELAYAGKNAIFQMPFVSLGVCPEAASSWILPNMLGHRRASELLLLSDKFDAYKAEKYGIVNEVLDDEQVFPMALEKAKRLASLPPASIRLTKSLMKTPFKDLIHETLMLEGGHFVERLGSEEAVEAFTAFFEKRKPDFSRFD